MYGVEKIEQRQQTDKRFAGHDLVDFLRARVRSMKPYQTTSNGPHRALTEFPQMLRASLTFEEALERSWLHWQTCIHYRSPEALLERLG